MLKPYCVAYSNPTLCCMLTLLCAIHTTASGGSKMGSRRAHSRSEPSLSSPWWGVSLLLLLLLLLLMMMMMLSQVKVSPRFQWHTQSSRSLTIICKEDTEKKDPMCETNLTMSMKMASPNFTLKCKEGFISCFSSWNWSSRNWYEALMLPGLCPFHFYSFLDHVIQSIRSTSADCRNTTCDQGRWRPSEARQVGRPSVQGSCGPSIKANIMSPLFAQGVQGHHPFSTAMFPRLPSCGVGRRCWQQTQHAR